LFLAPISGAALRRTDEGLQDEGQTYVFSQVTAPITIADDADIQATWCRMGLEVRHVGVVDLLVTPIVDGTEYPAQQFPLTATDPGGWKRSVLVPAIGDWFSIWGRKISARIVSNTLPALFHLDGAWFEGAPQERFRT
jgi:hypothetical protein